MRTLTVRFDVVGLLRNAADEFERLIQDRCNEAEYDRERADTDPDYDKEHPCGVYAELHLYDLRCLVNNIKEMRAGQHTLDEFAEFYCLTPDEPLAPVPGPDANAEPDLYAPDLGGEAGEGG